MIVLAIDPGSALSAMVWYDTARKRVERKLKVPNAEALTWLGRTERHADHLAIEMAQSFGAKVWDQVFTTVLWTGRFVQAWQPLGFTLVTRREVKLELAGSPSAKDGQIRNVLIDRFGGATAIGTKAAPGPLFGVKADCWQALAIAVLFADRLDLGARPDSTSRPTTNAGATP